MTNDALLQASPLPPILTPLSPQPQPSTSAIPMFQNSQETLMAAARREQQQQQQQQRSRNKARVTKGHGSAEEDGEGPASLPRFVRRRLALIERLAPNFTPHRVPSLRLARQPCEGFAWQADHIVPVYQGGGACALDNLRTLCVACHAEVTKAQAKERAAARAKLKEGTTRDIRVLLKEGAERR
eukprot:CAMPEP_0175059896 /NCGR_PEP_ID=MMETSP0052_2-20121109/12690_1 /TAXON_ID=51329 ORGANISM="Polytomella parva, Strain SAG 63-3" /NCGR_SAMPLE_ID=MMETSP0052_2 /ASSEMBLY_ACC=CAM_ASM_000194 /LENGTH=183 /DNA_ID=CAMNT_0016325503 /DNA_START=118 /DNA_END=665 /DNA_ORIENTATION=+